MSRKHVPELAMLVVVVLAIFVHRITVDPRVDDTGEHAPSAEEHATIEAIREQAIKFIRRNERFDRTFKRDAHLNPHGCVTAEFHVLPKLDPRLQQGVFSQPDKRFPVWVRFSNGTMADDTKPDGRGMAIKLLGVQGEKLMDDERQAQTQDFVMVNYPTFFLRDPEEYLEFFNKQVDGEQFGYFIGWNPLAWHLREFRLGLELLTQKVASPLATTYFSMLPFKLGNALNVKYSALPCAPNEAIDEPGRCEPLEHAMPDELGPHYLREALVDDLRPRAPASGQETPGARFVFRVQVQDPQRNMPIEDPTIEWTESASPYVAVAELTIPRQRFDSERQNAFCESLSFTPWHALPAHRPIGGLNRARRVLYEAIAKERHQGNRIPRLEPTGLDIGSVPATAPAPGASQ
jgi:hypothetical protein